MKTPKPELQCPHCKEGFFSKKALREHILLKHRKQSDEQG